MRILSIPKGGGRFRTIHVPSPREARRSRELLPVLAAAERRAAHAVGTESVAHGFVNGRSPVTMARAHRCCAVTVSADLAGWFDSVRAEQIAAGLVTAGETEWEAQRLAARACYHGAPVQGLPSSPAAANLAAVEFDRRILAGLPEGAIYTRYADDLAVSLRQDDPATVQRILILLAEVAREMGWAVAERKTKVQRASAGRRVICGVSVGDNLAATREAKRKLRAARHQGEASASTRGLSEWCAMRLPRAMRPARQIAGLSLDDAGSVPVSAPTPAKLTGTVPVSVVGQKVHGLAPRRIVLGG